MPNNVSHNNDDNSDGQSIALVSNLHTPRKNGHDNNMVKTWSKEPKAPR